MQAIFHTGITVSDIERSVVFYRDALGLKMTSGPDEVFEGEELSEAVGVPGTRMKLALFEVGDGALELIEYLSPKSEIERALPPNAVGAMHVAFRVGDAEAKMKELHAEGVEFMSSLNNEMTSIFVTGADIAKLVKKKTSKFLVRHWIFIKSLIISLFLFKRLQDLARLIISNFFNKIYTIHHGFVLIF
jgi:catechol 2,3-dioxygenase-like lactoylglutathione lyase family enzyme